MIYTITTHDAEYSGMIDGVPNQVFDLFSADDQETGLIALRTSDTGSSGEEMVYIRRCDIRSIRTWREFSDEAGAVSPVVGDLPLADDAPQE